MGNYPRVGNERVLQFLKLRVQRGSKVYAEEISLRSYLVMEKKGWEATHGTTFQLPDITIDKNATTRTHDGRLTTNPADPFVVAAVSAFGIGSATAALLWTPIADTYGRRPVYLFAGLTGVLGAITSSFASSIEGIGSSAPTVLTAISIADLFPRHERGAKIGVWDLPGIGPWGGHNTSTGETTECHTIVLGDKFKFHFRHWHITLGPTSIPVIFNVVFRSLQHSHWPTPLIVMVQVEEARSQH
ncbi:hypothetical protein Clacol_009595 [Clathrus columnatus]|uniref:Major facilitator superfamily (MFS) profile domain-containing protein n=1 Tax=Clathrus columnatus TaxID=1419009 RepID=A0AAV5AQ83_9AGAM|nr:hypothetical protein Clacol_009595 [Clathrus columnatus]